MASPYPPPRVFVFDDRRGASEGDELDKLLGIFPASTSRDAAAADVGLVQGVAGFMAPFQDAVDSPDAAGDDEPPPGGRRGGIGGSQPPPPTAPSVAYRIAVARIGSGGWVKGDPAHTNHHSVVKAHHIQMPKSTARSSR